MTAPVSFFVPGLPAPGGSKRGFVVNGRAVLTEDSKRSKPWRALVASAATDAHAGPPLEGPLSLDITFVFPRPRTHFGTGRNAGLLKPAAPRYHTSRPDTTKLIRSLEDSLKHILWKDDSQVAVQSASKVYGDRPGAHVRVEGVTGG